jgi:flagellar hook-basal body complex protein FliE
MTTPSIAAGAYANFARLTNPSVNIGQAVGGPSGGQNFGELLRRAVGNVVEAGRQADTQAQAMAAGKANVVDVVTAVAETEVAVEAMVAVRDKVISAYEEIMRMPI